MEGTHSIQPNQIVVSASVNQDAGSTIGVVDHIEGKFIKLKKSAVDSNGANWIPISWVRKVEDSVVYLSKTEREIRRDHRAESPFEYLPPNHGG